VLELRRSKPSRTPWAVLSGAEKAFRVSIDLNGNLASRSDGTNTWTYEWTAESQLARVLLDGQEVARFAYDALGRRVEQTAGGVTTTYLYDGDDILRESRGDETSYTYVHGPRRKAAS